MSRRRRKKNRNYSHYLSERQQREILTRISDRLHPFLPTKPKEVHNEQKRSNFYPVTKRRPVVSNQRRYSRLDKRRTRRRVPPDSQPPKDNRGQYQTIDRTPVPPSIRQKTCIQRHDRRRTLFALGKAGRGIAGPSKRLWRETSNIACHRR